jgi:hypothetical protein
LEGRLTFEVPRRLSGPVGMSQTQRLRTSILEACHSFIAHWQSSRGCMRKHWGWRCQFGEGDANPTACPKRLQMAILVSMNVKYSPFPSQLAHNSWYQHHIKLHKTTTTSGRSFEKPMMQVFTAISLVALCAVQVFANTNASEVAEPINISFNNNILK